MASDFVRPMTAHFAAAYGERMPMPYCPAVEEMLMIDPSRAAFIAGITRAQGPVVAREADGEASLPLLGADVPTSAVGLRCPRC